MPSSFPVLPIINPEEGICPFCAKKGQTDPFDVHLCDRCSRTISDYENMSGQGFQSPRPSHRHLALIASIPGYQMIYDELCLDCYQAEFAQVYPEQPLPPVPRQWGK
jgi:predicted amidophosphoribosyltransferase